MQERLHEDMDVDEQATASDQRGDEARASTTQMGDSRPTAGLSTVAQSHQCYNRGPKYQPNSRRLRYLDQRIDRIS